MKYDYNNIGLLLHIVEACSYNKYPKLKAIHDQAMQDLEDIASPPSEEVLKAKEEKEKALVAAEEKKLADAQAAEEARQEEEAKQMSVTEEESKELVKQPASTLPGSVTHNENGRRL